MRVKRTLRKINRRHIKPPSLLPPTGALEIVAYIGGPVINLGGMAFFNLATTSSRDTCFQEVPISNTFSFTL